MESFESKLAEEILPEEVWDIILGFVKDPGDVQRCYQTCPLFQSTLKSRVYSQALELVHAHAATSNTPLVERDILSYRAASRQCRKTVDIFLQSRPSRLDLSCHRSKSIGFQTSFFDQTEHAPNRFGSITLKLHRMEEARNLVEQITHNRRVIQGKNVLCGRHLIIVDTHGKQNESKETKALHKQQFYEIISTLLEACGSQIWHLSVCTLILGDIPHWFFHTFWNWLQLLPNLKMLTCQITLDYMQRITLKGLPELEVGVAQQPFPRLFNLVTLQMSGVPDAVVHSAINVNGHVRNLEIFPFPHRVRPPLNIHCWRNANLVELCITIFHVDELYQLANSPWPLEKLIISFSSGALPFSAIEQGLECIVWFGETLKYLRIKAPRMCLGAPSTKWELRLPHLEKLHLHLTDHATLDFILRLSSLKILKLSVVSWEERGIPLVIIQESSCPMDRLNESHIWEAIPSLRVIEVQISFHVRREDVGLTKQRLRQKLIFHRKKNKEAKL